MKAPQNLKWDKPRGPRWLREVIEKLFRELTSRTPVEGLGIYIDRTDNGSVISAASQPGGKASAAAAAAANDPDISFFLSDASVTEGDPPETSNRVLVADGKINGEFPSGMGVGQYILDLDDPADSIIHAIITFDPDTLDILSRDLAAAGSGALPTPGIDPDTNIGTFIVMLGFTYFDSDDVFRVTNTHLGHIDFELVYGALNGQPALLPVRSYGTWLPVPPPED
jgi:hypothetical protein